MPWPYHKHAMALPQTCHGPTTAQGCITCVELTRCFISTTQILLLVDASFGFEMETFEFLNICQVHGFPKIMGVLTHLDHFRNNKQLSKTKKRLKHRFWTEIYAVSSYVRRRLEMPLRKFIVLVLKICSIPQM